MEALWPLYHRNEGCHGPYFTPCFVPSSPRRRHRRSSFVRPFPVEKSAPFVTLSLVSLNPSHRQSYGKNSKKSTAAGLTFVS